MPPGGQSKWSRRKNGHRVLSLYDDVNATNCVYRSRRWILYFLFIRTYSVQFLIFHARMGGYISTPYWAVCSLLLHNLRHCFFSKPSWDWGSSRQGYVRHPPNFSSLFVRQILASRFDWDGHYLEHWLTPRDPSSKFKGISHYLLDIMLESHLWVRLEP